MWQTNCFGPNHKNRANYHFLVTQKATVQTPNIFSVVMKFLQRIIIKTPRSVLFAQFLVFFLLKSFSLVFHINSHIFGLTDPF